MLSVIEGATPVNLGPPPHPEPTQLPATDLNTFSICCIKLFMVSLIKLWNLRQQQLKRDTGHFVKCEHQENRQIFVNLFSPGKIKWIIKCMSFCLCVIWLFCYGYMYCLVLVFMLTETMIIHILTDCLILVGLFGWTNPDRGHAPNRAHTSSVPGLAAGRKSWLPRRQQWTHNGNQTRKLLLQQEQ